MSDRTRVIAMETHPGQHCGGWPDMVELFMDGESGTWRLIVAGRSTADFSLKTLMEFRDRLNVVLADIERDPDSLNAEVRAAWQDSHV